MFPNSLSSESPHKPARLSPDLPGASAPMKTPMEPEHTTSSTGRKGGYVIRNPSQRTKLLGFSQLSQTVKGTHPNLAQFDLNWGRQVPWQKVVEEWKQEQLEWASWRIREKRQRQLELRREHIRATQDQQQRTKMWTSSTPNTHSSRTALFTPQISPPHTPVTLTAPQCIEQLSDLIPPTSF